MNRILLSLLFVTITALPVMAADPITTLNLWPGKAPGDTTDPGPDVGTLASLSNVTTPTIAVYQPARDKDTGCAVVVCPGGGYTHLAYDHEGIQICNWLNSIGATGVLLKYRIPSRKGLEKHTAALQDVQRAIGLVRQHAPEWNIDPKRVGVLGFSAGGHLSAAVSNNYSQRTYPEIDAADKQSCRPDFTILIYPAYLTTKDDLSKLAPEIHVTKDTPPAFIVQTQDDGVKVENSYTYALALKNAKVSAELHVFPTGGHGYGMRPSKNAVSHWPTLAADWLEVQGWLKK